MMKDDIIRISEEADLWADQELQCIGEYHPDWHDVRDVRFANLVIKKAFEELAQKVEQMPFGDTGASFAAWIRGQE